MAHVTKPGTSVAAAAAAADAAYAGHEKVKKDKNRAMFVCECYLCGDDPEKDWSEENCKTRQFANQ